VSRLNRPPSSLGRALRNRSFRYLFAGITLSRIGDAMAFIVIAWLALGAGGARAVGLVMFLGGIVSPVTAPVIGFLLDRLGLRWLLLADNLGRGLLMLGLAGLVRTGQAKLSYLVIVAVLSAVLSPATELGQNTATPALVPDADLDAANRLLASSWDVSAWLGPAFAGFAIEAVGPAAVLVVDAATYFAMCFVALWLPGRPDQPPPAGKDRPGGQLLVGFRVLWQLRAVAVLTVVTTADLLLSGMMEVYLPALTKLTLHEPASRYGLLVSIAGLACLAGTLILTPFVGRLGPGRALAVVLAVRGLLLFPLAFAGTWGVAAIIVAVASVPDGSFFPVSQSIQQRLIPAELRGRVLGAKGALTAAGFPLGSALGGLLVAGLGTSAVAAIMAAGYLPLAAGILLTPELMHNGAAEAGQAAN
jgi:predicted MFS family arabinose efflux permease